MSQTYYKNLSENVLEDIKAHYGDENLYFKLIDGDFNEELVEIVQDAFVGDETTYLTVRFTESHIMYIISMTTEEFRMDWSEEIWAKFRADFNDTVCPHCGEQNAHSVAGQNLGDRRIEQFFCDGCGYGWIGHPNGEFIREGVLKSDWEM